MQLLPNFIIRSSRRRLPMRCCILASLVLAFSVSFKEIELQRTFFKLRIAAAGPSNKRGARPQQGGDRSNLFNSTFRFRSAEAKRLHLTNRLYPRLKSETRRNILATGKLKIVEKHETGFYITRATGTLVLAPTKSNPALVLTAAHVLTKQSEKLYFQSEGRDGYFYDHPLKVVTKNEELDYALLEVPLPADADWGVARFSRNPPSANSKTYTIGFPELSLIDPSHLGAQTARYVSSFADEIRETRDEMERAQIAGWETEKAISIGHLDGPAFSQLSSLVPSHWRSKLFHRTTPLRSSNIVSFGASGSPVFSAQTHKLLGVVHAMDAYEGKTIYLSTKEIIDDILSRERGPITRNLVDTIFSSLD